MIYLIWIIVTKYERNVNERNLIEKDARSVLKILRYWYGVAAILIIFKEVYFIIYYLKPADIDPLLIKFDFILFGVNPTQWAYRFKNPILTEFLQIVYAYYYPMIVVIGLQLYLGHRYKEFKFTIFILFFSFYFSYLLYFFFPANGPRFHLHEFYSITAELPGLFFTEHIRAFLNFGESIPPGVSNPQDYVQRDAMPSLHTITAFLIMYISWKIKSRSFYFYMPYFFCMVAATVYLRYHYVVDILAGLVVCAVTILLGNIVYRNRSISDT
ncbi:MAG: phosphatase PAP2 family protein [Ignavibacteria bacterium]|nr:phosphatase PAP2 family protein [Ignavibacteria bacterium]